MDLLQPSGANVVGEKSYEDSILSRALSQYTPRKKYQRDMHDTILTTHNVQESGSSYANYPADYFPIHHQDKANSFNLYDYHLCFQLLFKFLVYVMDYYL